MVDKAEPGLGPRTLPDIRTPILPSINWPERPHGFPRGQLEQAAASVQNPATSLSEKPMPFSLSEAPSSKISEERREELRDLGKGIAEKKLGLLDEGGIVETVKEVGKDERGFILTAYAEQVISTTTSEPSNAEESVEKQRDRQNIIGQVASLVNAREEAEKKEGKSESPTAA